jgi:Ca2+/Na+ antiporter
MVFVATLINVFVAVVVILKVLFLIRSPRSLVRWAGIFNLWSYIIFLALWCTMLGLRRNESVSLALSLTTPLVVFDIFYVIGMILVGKRLSKENGISERQVSIDNQNCLTTLVGRPRGSSGFARLAISEQIEAEDDDLLDEDQSCPSYCKSSCNFRNIAIISLLFLATYGILVFVSLIIGLTSTMGD